MSVADLQRLVYELQVHQIELDMQNEELGWAQVELKADRDRYADLYDFVPVGYLCLDPGWVIPETNLTVTQLFGMPRARMLGHRLTDWVVPEAQDTSTAINLCKKRIALCHKKPRSAWGIDVANFAYVAESGRP